jgi:hypothetical protein
MYEKFEVNQVFLGMQFASMNDVYEVLKKSCEDFELKSVRVDELANANSIIDDIKSLIEQSEFIIIDLTHSNPNVYYELGYVDGVGNEGKDILLLAQEGTKLFFNISHRRVLFYKDVYDLQEKLKTALPKLKMDGRK